MNNLSIAGRRVPPIPSYSKTSTIPSIGTKFGCWVVLENELLKKEGDRIRPACRVRCSCGREAVSSTTTLQKGRSTRCKHCAWANTFIKKRSYQERANPVIPIGTQFGRWTVIENGLRRGNIRIVRVRCECGTEKLRTYFSLRQGSSSCGCSRWERSMEAVWKAHYANLVRGARRRDLDVHLTLPQLKMIAKLPCSYCGERPSNVRRTKYGVFGTSKRMHDPAMDIVYSGIDRVDSTIGYVEGNMVPCCADCNIAKNKMSLSDFLALIARIRAHNPTIEGVHNLAATLFDGP